MTTILSRAERNRPGPPARDANSAPYVPGGGARFRGVDGLGALVWAIITTAFFCIPISLSVWALLDCAKRPGWAWGLSGRSRQAWMFAILCGILVVPVGLAVSCYYLVRIRTEIAGIEQGEFPE